jgi:hypothetical protein
VGAPYESDDSCPEFSGAAYVFLRQGDSWIVEKRFALGLCRNEGFGTSIALSDDGATLAVGIPGGRVSDDATTDEPTYLESGSGEDPKNNLLEKSGAVYVFTRSPSVWSSSAYVKASNPGEHDFFGSSLAISQDGAHLAVGARQEDSLSTGVDQDEGDNGATHAGAAYVFAIDERTYRREAYLKASNTGREEAFGNSIAMSADGSTVVVGAFREGGLATGVNSAVKDKDDMGEGAAYVFERIP